MPKSVIAEGKTTNEAISNGLRQLNVSKDKVEIKVIENKEKRSFFSILAPRNVQVELTLKEGVEENRHFAEKKNDIQRERKLPTEQEIECVKENVKNFLKDFSKSFNELNYEIKYENEFLNIEIKGQDSAKLIGYRGDVLNALQVILNSIANKNCEARIKVILNIGDYKQKREKALEELADKISKTVSKTGKSVTLEPMMAYERKIIHNRLQSSKYVKTYSIGEEPYRKVVIAKK